MNWHYRVKAPAEKVRDPIQGEFFSTEAIKNPADALVREALQNAMDAALRDGDGQPKDMLRVRFSWQRGSTRCQRSRRRPGSMTRGNISTHRAMDCANRLPKVKTVRIWFLRISTPSV